MLPLTKDKAAELFGEDVTIYQLHVDGSETLIEDSDNLEKHEGLFGVEKDDWSAFLEHQSMKKELEENPANREAQLYMAVRTDWVSISSKTPEKQGIFTL